MFAVHLLLWTVELEIRESHRGSYETMGIYVGEASFQGGSFHCGNNKFQGGMYIGGGTSRW